MRIALIALAASALAALPAQTQAMAAPQSHPAVDPLPAERCFEPTRVIRHHGDGDRALILRTDGDRYYRLSFAAPCANVVEPDATVVFKTGALSQVCDPVDLSVTVVSGRFPQICGVNAIHPMTPAEVRALPAKNRP